MMISIQDTMIFQWIPILLMYFNRVQQSYFDFFILGSWEKEVAVDDQRVDTPLMTLQRLDR